jgi:hypothetical protein
MVDLPDPLSPTRPKTSPCRISNFAPSTAVKYSRRDGRIAARHEALGDAVGLDQRLAAFGRVHGPAARKVLDGELRHAAAIADQRESGAA